MTDRNLLHGQCEHAAEVVAKGHPRLGQARCFCGWKGPIRLFMDDAAKDARLHDAIANGVQEFERWRAES